jgi:hypothetical protein
MREVLAEGMVTWLGMLSGVFDEAKVLGHISRDVDSHNEAEIFRDLWAGAIQRATIMKSTEPMRRSLVFLKQRIASYETSTTAGKAHA